jgi:hypothetical protein
MQKVIDILPCGVDTNACYRKWRDYLVRFYKWKDKLPRQIDGDVASLNGLLGNIAVKPFRCVEVF